VKKNIRKLLMGISIVGIMAVSQGCGMMMSDDGRMGMMGMSGMMGMMGMSNMSEMPEKNEKIETAKSDDNMATLHKDD